MTADETKYVVQRVIVTGGAGGLGAAIAARFAKSGARVFVGDANREALEDTLNITGGIEGAYCDVSSADSVAAFLDKAIAALCGVDVLVNNVGVAGPIGPLEENDPKAWEASVATNLFGAFRCTHGVIGYMKNQKSGAIINISSGSTSTTPPGRTAYVAAKAGLEGMTQSLAREVGPFGVRCNAIQPGPLRNERMIGVLRAQPGAFGKSDHELIAEASAFVSLRRFVEMDEVAAMVEFLCSPAGAAVTGKIIGVDCGIHYEA